MSAADLTRIQSHLAPFLALAQAVDPSDGTLTTLQTRLDALKPFLEGTAAGDLADAKTARDQAAKALEDFVDKWKGEFSRILLGALPELPGLRDGLAGGDWLSADGMNFSVDTGPLSLGVGLGAVIVPASAIVAGAPVDLAPLVLWPSQIDRLKASLSGPFPGEGALILLDDGFSGALRLALGPATVDALASLRRTPTGGLSFLGVISAGFTPAVQLSFGFALDRVGGVVGIERRVDLEALTRGIRSGDATAVLFGGGDAQRRLVAVEQLFPSQSGSHVVGPTFGLAWLSAGADLSLVHADIAVLVQTGSPAIIIVGRGTLELSELLRMRLDLAGAVDFARGRVGLDISLFEARVLGAFRLTGDAAFRLSAADGGGVTFSAGGFYPGFDPKPVEIGPLRRLSFATDIPTPGLDIRVEGYFAATSNTLQLGGRLDVGFDAALVTAHGGIAMDAIAQLRPFHFHAQVSGQVSVDFLGDTFCGVRVNATVDGPGPMSVNARLTIETFLKDIPWNETFTFGGGTADRAGRETSLRAALAQNVRAAPMLRASGGEDREVLLAPRQSASPDVVLPPGGELIWLQRLSPLAIRCDRLQSEPLIPPGQQVSASVVGPSIGTDELEPFAPGAYLNLSEALAMHAPAFEPRAAGLRIAFADDSAPGRDQPPDADVILIRPHMAPVVTSVAKALALGWARTVSGAGLAAPRVWTEDAVVDLKSETWLTRDGVPHGSAMMAWQHARYATPGAPVHAADPVLTLGGL